MMSYRAGRYILLALPYLTFLLCIVWADRPSISLSKEWYTKYSAYPPYCSTPAEMDSRTVPPLSDNDKAYGESRLVHVTVVARHGARTPWQGGLNCWKGYQQSPDTGVWNCSLTTFSGTPPPNVIRQQQQTPLDQDQPVSVGYANPMFLFEKHYSALLHPEYNLANDLNGTCQLGQLLLQGYEQELTNGQHLRDAYVYDENRHDHKQRMKLLDVSVSSTSLSMNGMGHVWDDIYLRSDDDQRTVMSAQVILRGLFAQELVQYYTKNQRFPIIPIYLADRDRDVMDPDENMCPRLGEIRDRHERKVEFRQFDNSDEAQALRKFQREVLQVEPDIDAIDCLMTTICTDRSLPEPLNDYTGSSSSSNNDGTRQGRRQLEEARDGIFGSSSNQAILSDSMFERLYNFEVLRFNIPWLANDAEYCKLGIGPLWAEIMLNINAFVNDRDTICCPSRRPPKLAIFSGHDTTIIPILASLGRRVYNKADWPAYASMVLIEIHEINVDGQKDSHVYKSNFAFRLVYNGKVLTHLVDGCPSDSQLCDTDVLINRVKPFAVLDRNCLLENEQGGLLTSSGNATSGGIANGSTFVLVAIMSAILGACSMYAYLAREGKKRNQYTNFVPEDDGITMQTVNRRIAGYSDAVTDSNGKEGHFIS